MTSKITVISLGHKPNDFIENLLELQDMEQINFILLNLLDYTLPPKVRNAIKQTYYHELRFILTQLGARKYVSISDSLSSLLKDNDRLNLDDEDLALISHISQIDQNAKNLKTTYNILLDETGREGISLHPLVEDEKPDLLIFKGKKYSPLRYFAESGELLNDEPPNPEKKRKYSDKKLTIEGLEELKSLKFKDELGDLIDEVDLVIVLASDLISLGTVMLSKDIKNQIKKTNTPIVFVWNLDEEVTESEAQALDAMELGQTLTDFASHISDLTDYVIIDRSQIDELESLREKGCKVVVEDFYDEEHKYTDKLMTSILSIGGIAHKNGDNPEEGSEVTIIKPISQLLESPEEIGIKKEEVIEDEPKEEKIVTEVEEDEIGDDYLETELLPDEKIDEDEKDEKKVEFEILEEEEWFDAVKRAIELAIINVGHPAVDWLATQSKNDNEKEQQIAESLISNWIESRSTTARKNGTRLIAKFAQEYMVVYQQILQRYMIQSVKEGQDERRRQLILLYHMLYEEIDEFTLLLIGSIVRDLASMPEDTPQTVFEISKITILQLVIDKKKLSNIAIGEILEVIGSKQGSNAELWNILTSFDASSVAIEMVTRFSVAKIDEMTRSSSILRFTGSFYSIISKVIGAWKKGDKVTLSNIISSILPEATLRKFERMELARSVEKLRMVQLNTLADTLSKPIANVEKLVTELIVNGELQAEFKLIDDKMYLVAIDHE